MQSISAVIIQTIFYTLCALLVAYTGIESYNYYKHKIKDHKSMWHFALTTFICVTLSFTTAVFFIPIITYNHKPNLCPAFLIIQAILSSTFKINLYLFFLQRIHSTFQYSIHEIHSWIINTLRVIIIFYWTTVAILQCALIYPQSNISNINGIYFCNLSNSVQIGMDILFISDCISESILCPLMLLLFIRGLYLVVSTRKNLSVRESVTLSNATYTNSVSENVKTNNSLNVSNTSTDHRNSKSFNDQQRNSITFNNTLSATNNTSNHNRSRSETMSEDGYDYNNKRDRNFVYAMTKFTTLANISFITSMLVYITLLICKYTSRNDTLNGLQIGIKLVFDQMINCFCVYFVFRFTDNKYHKYCAIPHQIQIKFMISLCPKTKPMFEVAKLEYQKTKLGMKRYASHCGSPQSKSNNATNSESKSKKKSQHKNIPKLNESNSNLPPVPEHKNNNLIVKITQNNNMKNIGDAINNETELTETETVQIYCDDDEIISSQPSIIEKVVTDTNDIDDAVSSENHIDTLMEND